MSLGRTLARMKKELRIKEDIREEIHSSMRKATHLSKNAIHFVHKGEFDEAVVSLEKAQKLFLRMRDISKDYQDLARGGIVDAAFEEYSEACILLRLIRGEDFPNSEDIGVPMVSYILGLADVVGELRRRILDLLRNGKHELAEKSLELMETIHVELIGLDDVYYTIKGLRRKCDIARRVIEATRGDITVEVRRSILKDSIDELQGILEGKE
jgi:translin